jgi:uncharacterized Zn finger protein
MNFSSPPITEASIRARTSEQSFSRGQEYYEGGFVLRLERREETLRGQVEGSSYGAYDVIVQLDADGVLLASCSCPYDWGGWCKHIVAVLLTCIHAPEKIIERPPLAELLAPLDREELAHLWTKLVEVHPRLLDWLEAQLSLSQAEQKKTASQGHRPLEPDTIRQQVHALLGSLRQMRPSDAYWHNGSIVHQLQEVMEQTQPDRKSVV